MTPDKQAARSGTMASAPSTHPRILYLSLYNLLFALLWVAVGARALTHYLHGSGRQALFESVEPLARWVQTLTLVEVIHAAIGLVKSPVSTTAIQVFTRVIQVWMIWWCFPESTASSHAFLVLVLAWAVADSIRYLYLALNLHGKAPQGLAWLRYVNRMILRWKRMTSREMVLTRWCVGTPCSTRCIRLVLARSGG